MGINLYLSNYDDDDDDDDDDDRIHRCLKVKTEEVTEDAEILSKAMLASRASH